LKNLISLIYSLTLDFTGEGKRDSASSWGGRRRGDLALLTLTPTTGERERSGEGKRDPEAPDLDPDPNHGDRERFGAPDPDPYTTGDRERSGWCAGVFGRISLPLSRRISVAEYFSRQFPMVAGSL
jgi:hypothetical protein